MSQLQHLLVLAHGLCDTPACVAALRREFAAAHPSLLIHVSTANSGVLSSFFSTRDGVRAGGARLAAELRGVLRDNPRVRKLSCVGVSLGGLYLRAAICDLSDDLRDIECVNYISIATPHTGVRSHLVTIAELAVRAGLLGATGRELLLADAATPADGTLAALCSDARAVAALSRFRVRTLVSNEVLDDKVPHASAALCGATPSLEAFAAQHPRLLQSTPLPDDAFHDFPHIASMWQQGQPHGEVADASPFGGTGGGVEAVMCASLRAIGGWRNVEVRMDEAGSWLLNHDRIAGSRPFLSNIGGDVRRFIARIVLEV